MSRAVPVREMCEIDMDWNFILQEEYIDSADESDVRCEKGKALEVMKG